MEVKYKKEKRRFVGGAIWQDLHYQEIFIMEREV